MQAWAGMRMIAGLQGMTDGAGAVDLGTATAVMETFLGNIRRPADKRTIAGGKATDRAT